MPCSCVDPVPLSITESPSDAKILRGSNHTFFCSGNRPVIYWEVNNTYIQNIPDDWKLKVVELDLSSHEDCVVESRMTVIVESSSMTNMTTTYTIQCFVTNGGLVDAPSKLAHLTVSGEFIYCMHFNISFTDFCTECNFTCLFVIK